MSKKLTLKSLALGAVIALGSSVFAGSPALALDPVLTVTPASGTSLSFISGEQFELKVSSNTAYNWTATSNLKWEVKNDSAVAVTTKYEVDGSTPDQGSATSATTDAVITAAGSSGTNTATSAGANRLGVAVPADKTATVTVRAYIESGATAGLDALDLASAPVTVSFIQSKDVVPTIAITAPVVGDATTGADISFNVNNEQLSGSDFKAWITTGTDTNLGAGEMKIALGSWSTTKKAFSVVTTGDSNLAADTAVKYQVYYKDGGNQTFAATEKVGSAATASVAARKVEMATANVVRGGTATGTASADATGSASTGTVNRNKEFKLKVSVKDNSATPKAVSGVAVTIKVAATDAAGNNAVTGFGTTSTAKSLTVNGTSYTDTAALPGATGVAKVSTTTDANGEAFITLKSTNFVVGDHIAAFFTVENRVRGISVMSVDPTYTMYAAASNGNVATTTDGAAASIPVVVYDEFGGAPDAGYEVLATWDAGNGSYSAQTTASTSATETKAALVNGKATLSITDNGTGTGVHVYDLDVKKLTGNSYGTSVASIANFKVRIKAAADLVPGTISVTGGTTNATTKVREITGGSLSLTDFGTYDERAVIGTEPSATNAVDISGTVTTLATATAAATLIPGAKVTVSGAGLQFKATVDSKSVYAVGSIDTYANDSGAYTLVVASNKAGKQTIKITSGSATQTVTVDFGNADDNSGTSLVVTGPKTIKSGRTLVLTGTITDKYGNPIVVTGATGDGAADLSVEYDGPGLVVGDLPIKTSSTGKFTVRVLLGSGDTGIASMTAYYDADGDANFNETGDLTASSNLLVGISASVSAGSKKANVVVKGAEGLTVKVVSGTKVATKTATSDSYKLSLSKLTSGSKTVKVYVNDILVTSKKVTVRR